MACTHRTAPRCSPHGLLLAVLAVLCQVVFAPVLASRMKQAAAFADIPLCHNGAADGTESGPAPEHRHDLPCPLCPVCQALAAVAVVPAPTPAGNAPVWVIAGPPLLPQPDPALPTPTVHAAIVPTGPPELA